MVSKCKRAGSVIQCILFSNTSSVVGTTTLDCAFPFAFASVAAAVAVFVAPAFFLSVVLQDAGIDVVRRLLAVKQAAESVVVVDRYAFAAADDSSGTAIQSGRHECRRGEGGQRACFCCSQEAGKAQVRA